MMKYGIITTGLILLGIMSCLLTMDCQLKSPLEEEEDLSLRLMASHESGAYPDGIDTLRFWLENNDHWSPSIIFYMHNYGYADVDFDVMGDAVRKFPKGAWISIPPRDSLPWYDVQIQTMCGIAHPWKWKRLTNKEITIDTTYSWVDTIVMVGNEPITKKKAIFDTIIGKGIVYGPYLEHGDTLFAGVWYRRLGTIWRFHVRSEKMPGQISNSDDMYFEYDTR